MHSIFSKLDNSINKFGFLMIILYKITLELIYIQLIVPIFYYSGFNISYDPFKYIFFWIILLLFYPFIKINYNKAKPSNAIITILYIAGFIPGIVLFSFMEVSIKLIALFLSYWIVLTIFNLLIPYIKIKRPGYQTGKTITYIIISYFSLIIIFISFKYTGFRLNFSLFNVYSLREEALNFQLPAILSYSFAAAKVFLPIAFIYMLSNHKNLQAFLIFFIQFMAFSIDGSKSTIFSIFLIYLCYKFYYGTPNKIFLGGMFLINIASLLEYCILKTFYLVNFLIRRLLFLPNLLHIYYFDFFDTNQVDYFRQGILGRIGFKSSYSTAIPNIIGEYYFNSASMIANNGLFSDAYYNLGGIGVVFLPLFIIVALRFLDACSKELKSSILISVIITSAYTFISSSFFTVMLTHGFLIICISLLFLPRKDSMK